MKGDKILRKVIPTFHTVFHPLWGENSTGIDKSGKIPPGCWKFGAGMLCKWGYIIQ
jgi:hypothetical protein